MVYVSNPFCDIINNNTDRMKSWLTREGSILDGIYLMFVDSMISSEVSERARALRKKTINIICEATAKLTQ